MVARRERDVAARVLRAFVAGEITNDDFDDQYPVCPADAAILAVYRQVWKFYDDLHEHKLVGGWTPSQQARDLLERCILFLEGDLEYRRPSGLFARLMDVFKDDGLWPFRSVEGLAAVRSVRRRDGPTGLSNK